MFSQCSHPEGGSQAPDLGELIADVQGEVARGLAAVGWAEDEIAEAIERHPKVDTLLERLRELISGGHRAQVFSQFARFLGRVRTRG